MLTIVPMGSSAVIDSLTDNGWLFSPTHCTALPLCALFHWQRKSLQGCRTGPWCLYLHTNSLRPSRSTSFLPAGCLLFYSWKSLFICFCLSFPEAWSDPQPPTLICPSCLCLPCPKVSFLSQGGSHNEAITFKWAMSNILFDICKNNYVGSWGTLVQSILYFVWYLLS